MRSSLALTFVGPPTFPVGNREAVGKTQEGARHARRVVSPQLVIEMTYKKVKLVDLLPKLSFVSPARLASMRKILEKLPKTAPNEIVADELIENNMITRWQADQMMHGVVDLSVEHFELIDQLGEGGMSVVYKALNLKTNKFFALKVLAPNLLQSEESMGRFRRETATLKKLRHPNIVAALEGDVDGSRPYFVMEYVHGRNLKSYLADWRKLPIPQACEIAKQIAQGLGHAHENGLAHRDIKPANIMITDVITTETTNVKILDMGLAAILSAADTARLTGSGQMLGSSDYIAPEQAKNSRSVTHRADIFSLGIVLFEMLTGEFPYPAEKRMDRLTQKMEQDACTLRTLMPNAPDGLNGLLKKMLQRKPEDRFKSVDEVVKQLKPFLPKHTGSR